MAKRIFSVFNWTPTGVADNSAFTDGGYCALQGITNAYQRAMISEVNISGLSSASAPTPMILGRDSTRGATLTSLATPNSDGPMNEAAPQSAFISAFVASTTKPIRSNSISVGKLALGLNAYGGIVRWVAAPGSEWFISDITGAMSETSLSCFTGGTPGAIETSIIYEPV